jgi:hypothetical protein
MNIIPATVLYPRESGVARIAESNDRFAEKLGPRDILHREMREGGKNSSSYFSVKEENEIKYQYISSE